MSRNRRRLKQTIHVRIPIATMQALEKKAREVAGTRVTPHGGVSKLVREAIASVLTNSDVQRAPALADCEQANTSPEVSTTPPPETDPGSFTDAPAVAA
jgi:hypothetical protein